MLSLVKPKALLCEFHHMRIAGESHMLHNQLGNIGNMVTDTGTCTTHDLLGLRILAKLATGMQDVRGISQVCSSNNET